MIRTILSGFVSISLIIRCFGKNGSKMFVDEVSESIKFKSRINTSCQIYKQILYKSLSGAMFFVRVYQAPKDPTIIKLSSKDARIHITVRL